MSNAWIFQKAEQVRDLGKDKASWYVGWYEPEGRRKKKSFGPGERGKRAAEKFRRKVEGQLRAGVDRSQLNKKGEDFRKEWEERVGAGLDSHTRAVTLTALNHFERLVKPFKVHFLTSAHVDQFVAARRAGRGRR